MELIFLAYNQTDTIPTLLDRPLELDGLISTPAKCHITDVPLEIADVIINQLDTEELLNLQLTCKAFRKYLAPKFWSRIHLSAGQVDRSRSRLTPARFPVGGTHDRYIKIQPGQLVNFYLSLVEGRCNEVLPLVKTFTADLQFYLSQPSRGPPQCVEDVIDAKPDELVYWLIDRIIPDRLKKLRLIELRSLVGAGSGEPVVTKLMQRYYDTTCNFELTSDEYCMAPPPISLDSVTRFRLILKREYTSFDLIRGHCCSAYLPPHIERFELIYNHFNTTAKIQSTDFREFFDQARSLKYLLLENIQVSNSPELIAWIPNGVTYLKVSDFADFVEHQGRKPIYHPNLETLELTTYYGYFLDTIAAPKLRNLSLYKQGPFMNDAPLPGDDSVTSVALLAQKSLNLKHILFKDYTFGSIAEILSHLPGVESLVVDEPRFAAAPPENDQDSADPGRCVADLLSVLKHCSVVSRLVLDLERFNKLQFVHVIGKLGAGIAPILAELYVKVLFKRPYRQFLRDVGSNFEHEGCSRVDLAKVNL